jgi:hypothetical protein
MAISPTAESRFVEAHVKIKTTESILDALLYSEKGFTGAWHRFRTLTKLERVDRRRVRYIAQLLQKKDKRPQDILKAAFLLRTVGYIDDAVRLLKKHKEFDEAADFLIVAGRGNEAAKLYEARRMWEKAARCYSRLTSVSMPRGAMSPATDRSKRRLFMSLPDSLPMLPVATNPHKFRAPRRFVMRMPVSFAQRWQCSKSGRNRIPKNSKPCRLATWTRWSSPWAKDVWMTGFSLSWKCGVEFPTLFASY